MSEEEIKALQADHEKALLEIDRLESALDEASNIALKEETRANSAEASAQVHKAMVADLNATVNAQKAYHSYVYTLLPIGIVSFEEYLEGKRSGEALDSYHKTVSETEAETTRRKIEQEFRDKISRKDIKINELQAKLESAKAELKEHKR